MMSKKYATTIELRGGEAEVVVEYVVHKGRAGRTYGPPEKCYEAEPAWVEIIDVTYGGNHITDNLPESQIEALQREIEESEQEERDYLEQEYADMRRKDARYPDYWEKYV